MNLKLSKIATFRRIPVFWEKLDKRLRWVKFFHIRHTTKEIYGAHHKQIRRDDSKQNLYI